MVCCQICNYIFARLSLESLFSCIILSTGLLLMWWEIISVVTNYSKGSLGICLIMCCIFTFSVKIMGTYCVPPKKWNKNVAIAQCLKIKVIIYWFFGEKVQLVYPLCTCNIYQMYLNLYRMIMIMFRVRYMIILGFYVMCTHIPNFYIQLEANYVEIYYISTCM